MEKKFLTANSNTQKVLYQAEKAARVDTSILILGESGTGKELLARQIHSCSQRHAKPFVALNCAAVPEGLLESELFGYEEGAFTGATEKRIGIFEYASEGTIFFDEIADIPPLVQVKLLRALQENEIKRLGSNRTIKVNPRIISATAHNLENALRSAQIREDFYYRLAVVTLQIPPLRERPEDVDLLSQHFIEKFAREMNKRNLKLSKGAKELLQQYAWIGNVRELENVIERAAVLSDGVIDRDKIEGGLKLDLDTIGEASYNLRAIAAEAAKRAEIELILRTLNQTSGNKAKAARLLGISYKTLLNKVKEYEITSPAAF